MKYFKKINDCISFPFWWTIIPRRFYDLNDYSDEEDMQIFFKTSNLDKNKIIQCWKDDPDIEKCIYEHLCIPNRSTHVCGKYKWLNVHFAFDHLIEATFYLTRKDKTRFVLHALTQTQDLCVVNYFHKD